MSAVQDTIIDTHGDQLASLHAEVEALREQLKRAQRLATVGTMTAMVAHEFNNILTPIINYARLAKTNPELVEKAIDRAEDGGERASTICKALLGMTRQESSEPEEVRLSEMIAETLEAIARDPKKDGIEFFLEAQPGLTMVTRRIELQQVILNLVINARAAVLESHGLRHVQVSVKRQGRDVIIKVSDNGVGIPPENRDRIFDPFFTTKAKSGEGLGGHGLGLAVCKDIVTSLGGKIFVKSEKDKGSTFTVRIPG